MNNCRMCGQGESVWCSTHNQANTIFTICKNKFWIFKAKRVADPDLGELGILVNPESLSNVLSKFVQYLLNKELK